METRRLRLLLELARLGSMREVAEELNVTTSTVSQQIALLARESGTALIEPDGRRVRLTPAGRRLATHAVTILAAVDAARLDLDPGAEPAGRLRVAGFATSFRRTLLPIVAELAVSHPGVRIEVLEHEPDEAFALLATDDVDLALTYDYTLAPVTFDATLSAQPLWTARWSLAVPAQTALSAFGDFRDHDWIVNSRNSCDEVVVRTVAAVHGFAARIAHRADSLDLVQDLILAGLGVGLLPADQPVVPGVRLLAITRPEVRQRSYAVTRRGRSGWAPLALVLARLARPPHRPGRSPRRPG
jgi:DNA-binding transcriptional LysR family regulator